MIPTCVAVIPIGPGRVIHSEGVCNKSFGGHFCIIVITFHKHHHRRISKTWHTCEVVAGKDWAMVYVSNSIHPFTALLVEAMPAGSTIDLYEPTTQITIRCKHKPQHAGGLLPVNTDAVTQERERGRDAVDDSHLQAFVQCQLDVCMMSAGHKPLSWFVWLPAKLI